MSRRGLMMAAGGGGGSPFGEFFAADEIHEKVDVEAVCEGGCAFSALIDNYSAADHSVCGISRINREWQLWLQHRRRGNLEVETIDGSESFGTESVEDGNPHHIVVNANSDVIRVYVDGEIIGERGGRDFYHDGTIYRVGAFTPVRNFRVWNRFLTEDEIQAVYQVDGR